MRTIVAALFALAFVSAQPAAACTSPSHHHAAKAGCGDAGCKAVGG